MAKKKYYVVWIGQKPGIYDSWAKCQLQINGFPGARYKSFPTESAAKTAFSRKYADYVNKGTGTSKKSSATSTVSKGIIWDSISVDAACSGNPGVMEYQGVDTKTQEQFFHQKFRLGTNNIGEFLGIVHALALFEKQGRTVPIYTDSKIAMIWVQKKKTSTKLKHDASTEVLHQLIKRGEDWLSTHSFRVPILKWETKKWGEIPADFGRK